ncbi:hypothetical protein ACAW63_19265 [Pseudomonas sp. QE6]|uniref:hypothetical protein n=1 Tax=Pseudomonas sp. QE6 TaxID=3242491 RepID=UPI0035294230
MPECLSSFVVRVAQWEKARATQSHLLVNALELVDGALWLVAGGRLSQAVSALHNAIELVLKAELERVHRALIADPRKLDYQALKSLLKEEFMAHPHGAGLAIPEYDMDRTITFSEALTRAKDLYPLIGKWEYGLKRLQSCRNQIVHYGSDKARLDEYVEQSFIVALPFLAEFLAHSNDISLEGLVGGDIYREVEVVRAFCEKVRSTGGSNYRSALTALNRTILYTNVEFPELVDHEGYVVDNFDRQYEMARTLRSELHGRWQGMVVRVTCKVCHSIHAFAEVDECEEGEEVVDSVPWSVACAVCGLDIQRNQVPLAELHYGMVPAKDIAESLADVPY